MANKQYKPAEIAQKLRQVDVLVSHGMQQRGIAEQSNYRWRRLYGGMGIDQLMELKRLQQENERLFEVASDLTLDKLILKEAARGNF